MAHRTTGEPAGADDVTVPLTLVSPFDGSSQAALLRLPSMPPAGRLPLVIAPHPFGWTVDEDYSGGYEGLHAPRHPGWRGIAARRGVAVLQPVGHHRVVQNASLGWAGWLADVPHWIDAVARVQPIDDDRIVACGLSMGALEAALAAGTHPDRFAGVVAINPVVDPAAWYEDLATTSLAQLRAEANERLIEQEVGGAPAQVPEAYLARSAFGVVPGLSRLPILIVWSPEDAVVPRQRERHGGALRDAILAFDPDAHVEQVVTRAAPGPSPADGWAIHETADYDAAVAWLLRHPRSGPGRERG